MIQPSASVILRGACCFEPNDPLAIAVIGGFFVSTLLLLFALPMMFGLMQRRK